MGPVVPWTEGSDVAPRAIWAWSGGMKDSDFFIYLERQDVQDIGSKVLSST